MYRVSTSMGASECVSFTRREGVPLYLMLACNVPACDSSAWYYPAVFEMRGVVGLEVGVHINVIVARCLVIGTMPFFAYLILSFESRK